MKRRIAFAAALVTLLPLDAPLSQPVPREAGPASAESVPVSLAPEAFRIRRERLMKQLGPGVAVLYSKGE